MTRDEIEAARKLAQEAFSKASPRAICGKPRKDGTAQVYSPGLGPLRKVVPIAETTAEFGPYIAAAWTALPAALDRIAALEAELMEERRLAKAVLDRAHGLEARSRSADERVHLVEALLREALTEAIYTNARSARLPAAFCARIRAALTPTGPGGAPSAPSGERKP